MKEFLVRLTNVIHWTCFLVAMLSTPGMLTSHTPAGPLDPWWLLNHLLPILSLLLSGWMLKYVLTGRKGFFPWMTK